MGFILIVVLVSGTIFAYWRYSNSKNREENQAIENTIPPLPVVESIPLPLETAETSVTALTEDEMAFEPTDDNTNLAEGDVKKLEEIATTDNPDNVESTSLANKSTTVKEEAWLRSQNPKSFTLQILGTHNPLTVKTFITKYSLSDVAQFKTKHRGKDWYVLVFGIYETRSQALSALKELPISLQQNTSPWVRTLSSIQNLIKE